MADTKTLDLTKFCDKDAVRYALSTPFRLGDMVVACDGRIMVAVDASLAPDYLPPEGRIPDALPSIIAEALAVTDWQPMPTYEKCGDCEDVGVTRRRCGCGGTMHVECFECGHVRDCEECEDGWCEDYCECDVLFGELWIAKRFVHALSSQFDNLEWGYCGWKGGGRLKPGSVAVRFTGGVGVIMPLMKD